MKAPGPKRLKVKCNRMLSILLQFCFQFNLRRYGVGVIHYVESPFVMVGCCNLKPDAARAEAAPGFSFRA